MNRIIAVNSNCYHGFSIEEAIEGIAAAGFSSGRAANGAANAKRPSTTARRNVFLKGQTLLAICCARLYNRDIPRGLSQYTRGSPLL